MSSYSENGSGSDNGNVRYVVAGTPVGWAAMAKTLRDVDEGKIRDYKEDMDTLLVFAGLFSAVLTAFLVESYKTLQIDSSATSVSILRQIALQTSGYTVSDGNINSIHALPASIASSDPENTYAPSLAAIRVNVLWFAALILSLSTASFAILIKQWLREYLSGEYTSGQARLRVRQFRHPGLADWKVFEIAAVLPLIVQLALGCFLLGLCFFTWSVHISVGLASIPLVAGWATLFWATVIAPLFSPRCPFKMTLTKRAMRGLRRLLWSIPPLGSVLHDLQRRHDMPKPGQTFGSMESASVFGASRHRPPLYEEEDAAKDERQDLSILSSVDSILQDDDLLGSTMLESLQQAQFEPAEVVDFAFGALQRRSPIQYNVRLEAEPPSSLLDLRQLRKPGCEAVMNIMADIVCKYLGESTSVSMMFPLWMGNALLILLSYYNFPLTLNANRALSLCLTGAEMRERTALAIAGRTAPTKPGSLSYVLRRLRTAFALLSPGDVVWSLLSILQHTVCRDHQHSKEQLVEFFCVHDRSLLPDGAAQAVLAIIIDCVNRELSSATGLAADWSEWTRHALRALLSCDVPWDTRHDVSRLVTTLTRRSSTSYGTLLNAVALDNSYRAAEAPALFTFKNAFTDSDTAERRSILSNMTSLNEQYVRGTLDEDGTVPMNPVRLCRLAVYLYQGQHGSDDLRDEWKAFWLKSAAAVREFSTREYNKEEQQYLALECLSLLDVLDTAPHDRKLPYATWTAKFKQEESRFPEEIFEQLDVFIPGEEALKHMRTRRLRERKESMA